MIFDSSDKQCADFHLNNPAQFRRTDYRVFPGVLRKDGDTVIGNRTDTVQTAGDPSRLFYGSAADITISMIILRSQTKHKADAACKFPGKRRIVQQLIEAVIRVLYVVDAVAVDWMNGQICIAGTYKVGQSRIGGVFPFSREEIIK